MGQPLDLTGRRFGRLVAREPDGSRHKQRLWLCDCKCGRSCLVMARNLVSGCTQACPVCGRAPKRCTICGGDYWCRVSTSRTCAQAACKAELARRKGERRQANTTPEQRVARCRKECERGRNQRWQPHPCIVCGKTIQGALQGVQICSYACRRERAKEYRRRFRERNAPLNRQITQLENHLGNETLS